MHWPNGNDGTFSFLETNVLDSFSPTPDAAMLRKRGSFSVSMRCYCEQISSLIDKNGINPCYVGELPPQLAALNRTNINVQSLIVEAALNREREAVYHAVMVDPLTSALLTLDEIRSMVDEMFDAQKRWLPEME